MGFLWPAMTISPQAHTNLTGLLPRTLPILRPQSGHILMASLARLRMSIPPYLAFFLWPYT